MTGVFMDLLKNLFKVLMLHHQIPPMKKVILFLYNRAYKHITHETFAPGWSRYKQCRKKVSRLPLNDPSIPHLVFWLI